MPESHDVQPDGPMTEDELEAVRALSSQAVSQIDQFLLAHAGQHRRRVAMIVSLAMEDASEIAPDIPDIFFAERVKALVAAGKLMAFGDLNYMRYSEVRLP